MSGARGIVVAIDGPAGAGKSTVARQVAGALGYTLVDTGSLYRASALVAERAGVSMGDQAGVEGTVSAAVARGALRLEAGDAGLTRVLVDGEDPAEALRTPAMSMGASAVAAYPGVREALLEAQRAFGRTGGVVLEGRDIGTVVFPKAELKVFLTASAEERARRRCDELRLRGIDADYAVTLAEVRQRDHQDASREIAPLREADDAVRVGQQRDGAPGGGRRDRRIGQGARRGLTGFGVCSNRPGTGPKGFHRPITLLGLSFTVPCIRWVSLARRWSSRRTPGVSKQGARGGTGQRTTA
jgi:cytidylate kinase